MRVDTQGRHRNVEIGQCTESNVEIEKCTDRVIDKQIDRQTDIWSNLKIG